MVHLKSVHINQDRIPVNEYPFNLPIIKNLGSLAFHKQVTILVGDNGTGKSTLLEAIASNSESILIGGEAFDSELSVKLRDQLKLVWRIKTRKGFFFRANDFNHFINRLKDIKAESRQAIRDIKERDSNSLEVMPYARTLSDLERLYGQGLEVRSHGESFLDLFQARLQPDGLYILDEPEAPLSPLKQLTLISMMKEMVQNNCQFIIATHSPILMAFPDAEILSIQDGMLQQATYDELEHVTLTRDFLNHPERFLRHL
ncbi:AAA family ATPase [Jeotgalibacillus haloalkalitolerans]|uniref:AAA family ATPase n=1 Tax=Jeotgalibacillus haloalkalitolerans TaxID=3104292 RepID=A0ABU5KNB5_9BACL|nr:AAA family ATPase [Jeotgalibacillus sp. HH7-29]MDZ5712660.1 AAA family ATPase [Jeotgalibacillus sp. HH7-29]